MRDPAIKLLPKGAERREIATFLARMDQLGIVNGEINMGTLAGVLRASPGEQPAVLSRVAVRDGELNFDNYLAAIVGRLAPEEAVLDPLSGEELDVGQAELLWRHYTAREDRPFGHIVHYVRSFDLSCTDGGIFSARLALRIIPDPESPTLSARERIETPEGVVYREAMVGMPELFATVRDRSRWAAALINFSNREDGVAPRSELAAAAFSVFFPDPTIDPAADPLSDSWAKGGFLAISAKAFFQYDGPGQVQFIEQTLARIYEGQTKTQARVRGWILNTLLA